MPKTVVFSLLVLFQAISVGFNTLKDWVKNTTEL